MEDKNKQYRTQPVHHFPSLTLEAGYGAMARSMQEYIDEATAPALIVIDGFVGVQWRLFAQQLYFALQQLGVTALWLSTEPCFRSAEQIEAIVAPSLTRDPVFGRIFRGHMEELWEEQRVAALRRQVNERAQATILYGFGASLIASEPALTIYVDVPKDRGQELAGKRVITNVGAAEPQSFGAMYKRFYFVDWPMLNRVKRALLPGLDLFVDATDQDQPVFVEGDAFRAALSELASRPFRVKPWFAPGPWGGQWMKEQFGLPPEQPNYAWSFELIAPENGLLLGDGRYVLECSFDMLLWQETNAVLGVPVAARYGSYFPIRFDYLDTMEGGNLSCQVHPRVDYIRDEFGEPFTQDETYYIVTNKPGARVFLGLRDDADLARFHADAQAARDHGIAFDINEHVHSVESAPHDLFLIPSGTVHCSGQNNLVLEISATPYIFTFKIYDYLRSDLSGKLRHVHLEHAFANIDETRRATWVNAHLCSRPVLLRGGDTWSEYVIGDIEQLFFAIHRLEFTDAIEDTTQGKFLALNLVEGEACEVLSEGNEPMELRFAESLIIPASVGDYALRNLGERPCKVVKAFVK